MFPIPDFAVCSLVTSVHCFLPRSSMQIFAQRSGVNAVACAIRKGGFDKAKALIPLRSSECICMMLSGGVCTRARRWWVPGGMGDTAPVHHVRRYIMPTLQPYGGWGWPLACLLPPSAISLFATVLLKLEGSQRGVRWGNA